MQIEEVNVTEKFKELAKKRKTIIIFTKMGSVKKSDKSYFSSTSESYSYIGYDQ